jgi:hypothetical protein
MRVGVSYGKGDYSWQNLTFYDSLCRQCDDSNGYVNSQFIKPGTCVSKTGMCRKINVIIQFLLLIIIFKIFNKNIVKRKMY